MKTEDWQRVHQIVLDALDLSNSSRQKFVEKRCATNPELRREVESLLACESGAEKIFESSAVVNYASFFVENEESDNLTGRQIGNYRILREIGYGGMGSVHLAERADGKFSQLVAVKILKRELNTQEFRRNFNREKEILASLSHPNIAALIDAGTTADGVPYLVMQYIEGLPVDVFCRENSLTLNERLKLFNRVCEAVAFAHRNLIVHRDLKPSNILVTADGNPKLLDFGISKLLSASSDDEQTITHLGAMTLRYASPEQIRNESGTTATDIYSLGVILFKLLTGDFPYDFKDKSDGNILRAITESEPTMPSRTISCSKNDEIKSISAAQLKGDLDNIILKALRKEPERRYKTVEQFTADIWRFIDGLPVLARRGTFSYRAKKFYRRNQVAVLASVLILISLCSGILIAFSQAREAREQAQVASDARQIAEIETKKAKAEQDKAEKISRFMAKVISYANPSWYAEGGRFKGEVKLIDVMNDLGEKIDVEFAGQPDVQAELHHKFAEVYNFYKTGARARRAKGKELYHAQRALDLRQQYYGKHHELVAKDMFYLYSASGYGDDVSNQARHLVKAIQMMRETNPQNLNLPYMIEAYTSRLMMPEGEPFRETYQQAILPLTSESKYEIGERLLRESLPIFRLHYKQDNSAIFINECKLAYALAMQEKWADFDEHYAICRQSNGSSAAAKEYAELIKRTVAEKNMKSKIADAPEPR